MIFQKSVVVYVFAISVNLNQQQAKQFAKAVYADIADYIRDHEDEYRQFLAEEYCSNNSNSEETNITCSI